MRHCYLYPSWYLQNVDEGHDELCREAFFAQLETPIRYECLKIALCPRTAETINTFDVHISLTAAAIMMLEKQKNDCLSADGDVQAGAGT